MIKNYTPHPLTIEINSAEPIILPSEGSVRIDNELIGTINDIPIYRPLAKVKGLPQESPGIYYVVSAIVKAVLKERRDLLVPYDLRKDTHGNIISCKGFSI